MGSDGCDGRDGGRHPSQPLPPRYGVPRRYYNDAKIMGTTGRSSANRLQEVTDVARPFFTAAASSLLRPKGASPQPFVARFGASQRTRSSTSGLTAISIAPAVSPPLQRPAACIFWRSIPPFSHRFCPGLRSGHRVGEGFGGIVAHLSQRAESFVTRGWKEGYAGATAFEVLVS